MTEIEIRKIKENLEKLKSDLHRLKEYAALIVKQAENEQFVADAALATLTEAMQDYRKNAALLQQAGAELSFSLENSSFSELDSVIANAEESLRKNSVRMIVLDYFRLTAEAEDVRLALEASKSVLSEKCRSFAGKEDSFKPYQIVVESVKSERGLTDDEFDEVEKGVSRKIALAGVRNKEIRYEDSTDITRFLDGSCELLQPVEKVEASGQEVAKQEDTDRSKHESDEEVPVNSDVLEKDEGEDSAPLSDAAAVPEEPKDTDKTEMPLVEEIDGEQVLGRECCLVRDLDFSFSDVPASQLKVSRFINLSKQYPELLRAMFTIGTEKIISALGCETKDPEYYAPSDDILRILKKEQLISEITLSSETDHHTFLTLTSKGCACYSKADIVRHINNTGAFRIGKKIVHNASDWNAADFYRYLLLRQFCLSQKPARNYVVAYSKENSVPVGVINDKNPSKSIYPFAFNQDEELNFYELVDGAISGLKNKPDWQIILLVTSKSSIDWGRAVLQIDPAVKHQVRICVLPECAVFYDIEGNVVDDSNENESEDTGKTAAYPEEEMPDNANASDEAPLTDKAVPENGRKDVSELLAADAESKDSHPSDCDEDVQPECKESPNDEPLLTQSEDVPVKRAVEQLCAAGMLYCATAFLKAAADKSPSYRHDYEQFAYAVNDPMVHSIYSSEKIFEVYYGDASSASEYFTLAAALRNYFSDQCSYDYNIRRLQNTISGMRLLTESPVLNRIAYTISEFKVTHNKGMDVYADYRQQAYAASESRIQTIKSEAADLYANLVEGKSRESIPMKRFVDAKRFLFDRKGDFAVCLSIAAQDDRNEVELIKGHLYDKYIVDGATISSANLDENKIDKVIKYCWDEVGKTMTLKKNAQLMGELYNNLFKTIKRVASLLCDYAAAVGENPIDTKDQAFIQYQRECPVLRKDISEALEQLACDANSESKVLIEVLKELLDKLTGEYEEDSHRYFYLDFLKNNHVLLDDNYLPILDRVEHLEEMSPERRILLHAEEPLRSLQNRLDEIFSGGDDFGSARLILRWMKMHETEGVDLSSYEENFEQSAKQPLDDVNNRHAAFIADMEMAQSQGQIDNADGNYKDSVLQTVERWREILEANENYGFFYQILDAFRAQIRSKALIRAKDMDESLGRYLQKNPKWESDPDTAEVVRRIQTRIANQNYSSAEDLLNRLQANDTELDTELHPKDYLAEFLNEYTTNSNRVGSPQKTLQQLYHVHGQNKDTRGAQRLIESWPNGAGVSKERIQNLFMMLGFQVAEVKKQDAINRKDHFTVRLMSPENGRKANYKHPIYVFGSEAEKDDFRVVCIFGKMDADRLIETFKDIGSTKNTIILLDYALTIPERQSLARKVKAIYIGKTFAVIDRVVLAYLANHYTETEINRRLMAVIMPYSAFQPYVADSARVMPPEIFMGRKTELEKIESAAGVNIVYGGRQLGKSALLRMAKKDIDCDENGNRSVLVDIKGKTYKEAAKKISAALSDEKFFHTEMITEDWAVLSRAIKNRLRDESSRIPYFLLLLDEADAFIESCEKIGYAPFDELKDIQSIGSGRFKFVVAGLRNVVRFNRDAALGNNSVLTHLSSLTVKPFRYTEARELLEVPLSYLGFRFPDDEKTDSLVSNICGTTNYFPGLIQLYCAKLIEAMKQDYAGYPEATTPPYYVREEHIKRVLADKTLTSQIKEKFDITLKVDEDDYYYIIALLCAYVYHVSGKNSFSAEDILSQASEYMISKIDSLGANRVDALMKEMCELNVLQDTGNGSYRFARYSFYQMMGTLTEIEDEILKYGGMGG